MTDTTLTDETVTQLEALVAKQAITEVLFRRSRAGDRRDVELALTCYHEGATEDHEGYSGTVADFLRDVSIISPNSKAPVTSLWHFISNVLIELRGDEADVESYHIALVERDAGDGVTQSFIGGRYLDTFTFRDGRWAIQNRAVVFDWSRVESPTPAYWDVAGLDVSKILRGSFGPEDPLYSHLATTRG